MALTVTVVGTGRIGTTLARAWHNAGMDVRLASRAPEQATVADLPVLNMEAALPGSDVVVTAIPGAAVGGLLSEHAASLAGIPLVDASNNAAAATMHHAAQAGTLVYYRAFNTLGVENFADPVFDGVAADLFYSGPQSHRETVESLIAAVGLRPVWVGEGVQAADLLDGVTRLWFTLALQQRRGRHLAFRMLP